ncbi:glycosyltransferase family 8 protein [Candidatus Saccharibacteria bacterium]|nr:glycosyltransferase family 8 protein [Candidatus Saccharibacteria bacterium]
MINILFCGDKNILDGLIISTLSLAKHSSQPLNIFVMTMKQRGYKEIPQSAISTLEKILQKRNPKHKIHLIDATRQFNSDPPRANMRSLFTPYSLLRLYADLVEELPEKILYLDTDVVALQDPNQLYQIDNSEYEIVGALDYYGQHWIRTNPFEKSYMNSGVLLLNLKQIRATGLFQKTRKRVKRTKMLLPDQTSLNIYAKRKLLVDRRFNEQKNATSTTVFRHFSTTFRFWPVFHTQKIKPWDIERVHKILKYHGIDDILDEYQSIKQDIIK